MTFYLDVRMWMRMVRLALRACNPKAKRRMLVLLVGVVPVVAVVHAICFFLDPIVFPRLRDVEVRHAGVHRRPRPQRHDAVAPPDVRWTPAGSASSGSTRCSCRR